jgi:uncharacterized glyoxalase superfamily protein PhnB
MRSYNNSTQADRVAAQSLSGEIDITVVDRTDAVIPGAKITVSRAGMSGVIRSLVTGATRAARASLPDVGMYDISIDAQGFNKLIRSDIAVTAALFEWLTLNLFLEPPKPRDPATMNPTPMTFPAPVPEIPAANVDNAAAYYVNTLGFTFDWGDEQGGIAGISRGNCRLFITNRSFRESYGNIGPILFWLNLQSKAEVDELFAEWKAAQAKIVSEPGDKPWKLREFMAADLDGNLIRVFYDFRGDM